MTKEQKTTVFQNVNVIPMDRKRVLENQTVVVADGRIQSIGPVGEEAVPEGAIIVDGKGGYLMPGLADMHMHFVSIGQTFTGPGQLWLFLAEGVTTVRCFSGVPETLTWREEVANGKRVGPTIYSAGPLIVGLPEQLAFLRWQFLGLVVFTPVLVGLLIWLLVWAALALSGNHPLFSQISSFIVPSLLILLILGGLAAWFRVIPLHKFVARRLPFARVAETAAEAREAVRDQKEAGYDFIKVYDYLSHEAYLAAIDEAKKQDIYVSGHLLDVLKPEVIFSAGLREAAHVDEFIDSHIIGKTSPNSGFNEVRFDYDLINQTADVLKENDAMVIANMVADETVLQLLEDRDALLNQAQYAIISPDVIEKWKTEGRVINWQGQQEWRRQQLRPFLMTLTKTFFDKGVPLLTGTDISVEGMIPAHIHGDLELLVEAGLTPYEALAASTKNAALAVQRMGGDGNFGTVAPGQKADLILLKQNPLENVSFTRERVGVVVKGKWFTQEALNERVKAYTASYPYK